jgi:hypothetical protein
MSALAAVARVAAQVDASIDAAAEVRRALIRGRATTGAENALLASHAGVSAHTAVRRVVLGVDAGAVATAIGYPALDIATAAVVRVVQNRNTVAVAVLLRGAAAGALPLHAELIRIASTTALATVLRVVLDIDTQTAAAAFVRRTRVIASTAIVRVGLQVQALAVARFQRIRAIAGSVHAFLLPLASIIALAAVVRVAHQIRALAVAHLLVSFLTDTVTVPTCLARFAFFVAKAAVFWVGLLINALVVAAQTVALFGNATA